MKLGLINSWRNTELASGNQEVTSEKIDGQFLSMINALKTNREQSNPIQKDNQKKDGLNDLLTILSSSSDASIGLDGKSNLDVGNDQPSSNLEHLLTTYHHFSTGEDFPHLDTSEKTKILADLLINMEDQITQVLKKQSNPEITQDMFNHTELPILLIDLKMLENTVEMLVPDMSLKGKVAETVHDLQSLIRSLNKVVEENSSNTMKNMEKDEDSIKGNWISNESNFISRYNNLSQTENSLPVTETNLKQQPVQKVEASSEEQFNTQALKPEIKSDMHIPEKQIDRNEEIIVNPNIGYKEHINENRDDQKETSFPSIKHVNNLLTIGNNSYQTERELTTVGIFQDEIRTSSEGRLIKIDQAEITHQTVDKHSKTNDKSVSVNELWVGDAQEAEVISQPLGDLHYENENPKEYRFSSVTSAINTIEEMSTPDSNEKQKTNPTATSQFFSADNQGNHDTTDKPLLHPSQTVNSGMESVKENSNTPDTNSIEETVEEQVTASKDRGDIQRRYTTIDTNLLAMQNRLLKEKGTFITREANPTSAKLTSSQISLPNITQADRGENRIAQSSNELKSIISAILSEVDKQLEGKSSTVVQKVINPIMVSSIRKSSELLVANTSLKESSEVNLEEVDTKILPSIQSTFVKQQPLMVLSNTGAGVQPKNVEEQFAKLLANSTFTKIGDTQKLSIRLAPDHLGSIRIELTQNEGNMIARIITTTAEAKEVLDKQLTSLKHGFTAQNLQVDKIDIIVSSQQQEKLQKDQQQQQEQHQSPSQREKKEADDEENNQKTSFFEELLKMDV
ncbi:MULTISPECIES: flagellar hook-length control protein FliK [Niallia]|uniref:Flagellar hook-length control protein-like C-terminal domain-containing protein n=1 Tax=Niallia alba TaxID=2729105 RepID=A0A7Y0K7N9_9BACI|nr:MULTISPECIES: flagellar hook-length control protein FliK [Niallia]NMO77348.1 hypothetical protein [Niallia alba]UTI40556.1 flagellar hook-length control protein FliK [Niallia sp. RD1]